MSYCIYLRKSRADYELEERGEMETLARHETALLALAKQLNLSVTQIYKEVVSGETIAARPVVQKLLDEVEQGVWEGVLVMEVERLARGDTIDQGIVARAFKMGNTKIITPTKTYDPNNEFDEEYFEFGLFMSRREYKAINRRIQRGRLASVKEGKYIASAPPYGYDKIKIKGDKGYTLTPNEEEAEVVKFIFERYLQGDGMTIIARELDKMGVKPKKGDTWSKATLQNIISNPVYIGKIRWAYKQETHFVENGMLRKKTKKNDKYILVDGIHPPLISEEEFYRAQEIKQRNTKKTLKADLTLKNPLSGLVFCKKCGQMMTRLGPHPRTPYSALICPNRYCDTVSAPLFLVEEKLLEQLREWLEEYEIHLKNNEKAESHISRDIMIKKQALQKMNEELEKLEKQISNTYDLLEQEVYTVEIFMKRNQELSKRKEELIKSKQELENDLQKLIQDETKLEIAVPRIKKVLEGYHKLEDAEDKNKLLHEVIERIEYYKDTPNTRGKLLNDNFGLDIKPKLG